MKYRNHSRRLFTFLTILFCLSLMACKSTLFIPKYKGKKSQNFDGRKFKNHHDAKMGSFSKLFWYQLTNKRAIWTTQENHKREKQLDLFNKKNLRITHINHATVLLQLGDVNILTDPVFVKRASPYQFMGPKRFRKPAIELNVLPKIDYIILSHDHYDHLDIQSIQHIQQKDYAHVLVGLGLKAFLEGFGIQQVHEFDWKDKKTFGEIEFVFHTAKHWSNRGFQPYRSLWGSWIVKDAKTTIYYAGDTGYGTHFKDIKNEYKRIDLALLPIGAYKPRFFMKHVHMDPEDAVKAHQDLDPELSVAVHWGTFQLTHEGMFDPVNELEVLLEKQNISNFRFDRHHNLTFELALD